MFFMVLLLIAMLAGAGLLIGIGCRRVASHLRDKPDATRMVVEHVLMPLFGGTATTSRVSSRKPCEVGSESDRG